MRKIKIQIIVLTLIILCGLCTHVYAEDITELQENSNELTKQLDETNNQLRAVQDKISEEMKKIQEIDEQITESQAEITNINDSIEKLVSQINENTEKLEKVQKEYDSLEGLIDQRLIQMSERPKLKYLEIILTSNNFTEMLSNYYSLKEMIEYDNELLDTVRNQKNEIETTKKILVEKQKQLTENKQTKQKKAQVLENTKTTRKYYMSKLTEEELELQQQIDEYNAQVADIETEIRLLALNSISEDYIGGAFAWPVPGYTRLTSTYGMRVHPITGAYKLHTGIDIGAPMGTSFVASANGIVSKATFNTAYGNMVIIDHGGGVQTLYAHGSEILVQVGQTVGTGTEVLKVGSTGYSTGPHAHFEIRINGQTVDPLVYLLNLDKNENKQENEESTNTATIEE